MKIAHLLPYSVRFPLSKHNGRYEWALRLARLQAADGHEVTFYSGPGSRDESSIIWASVEAHSENRRANNLKLISKALGGGHDIYHSHFDDLHYQVADTTDRPIVVTQHWFPNNRIAQASRQNKTKNVTAVPSSDFMAKEDNMLAIKHGPIIRQGVDLELFSFNGRPNSDRLIFVGRIAPWKGVLGAVRVAKAAGQPLDIIGKLNSSEYDYWKRIEPLVDGDRIRYLGPKKHEEIASLFANAKAFLFPSQSPEAAPQTPIEAQACGTPVIMSGVGAASEWLLPGKTGFIAGSKQDFLEAIAKLDMIDRAECRKFAEKFDIKIMLHKYYDLYTRLLS
jgi:glycosyltransferase involved in cell wall biosynthesis